MSEVAVQIIEDESTVSERARKKSGSSDGKPMKLSVNRVTNLLDVVKDFFADPIRSVVVAVSFGADKGFAIIHQIMQFAKVEARTVQATVKNAHSGANRAGPDMR
jgi:hypothetical protein